MLLTKRIRNSNDESKERFDPFLQHRLAHIWKIVREGKKVIHISNY
jgi:hypothetical protein